MEIICPKCGEECEGEDLGDHPCFLTCECDCGFYFSYDSYRDELYDNKSGNVIKPFNSK